MKAIALGVLNIREKPSVTSNLLGQIHKLTILDIGNRIGDYYQLLNMQGFVSAFWVNTTIENGKQMITTDGLNIRNEPNILGIRLGSVASNTPVTVNETFQANGYVLVTMPFLGYVLRSFLNDSTDTVPSTPNPQNRHSLVGLHVETPTSNAILLMAQRLYHAGKPLAAITILDDIGLANELAKYVLHVNFRSYPHGQLFNPAKCDTAENARNHANFIYAQHYPVVSQLRGTNITVQFRNENSVFPHDSDFEYQLMLNADRDRLFKVGLFGDSLGSPEIAQWDTREFALAYAMAHGHVVIIHEYGAMINGRPASIPMVDPATRQWYGLRHEMLYASVPANCRPLCIIGECGLSSAVPDTIEDIRGYNQLLLNDAYIIGFCLWGFGATAPNYNANPMLPAIEALVLSL